jgi:hypothetical protein
MIVYRRLTISSVTWKKSLLPDANVIYKEVNYMLIWNLTWKHIMCWFILDVNR